jgi:FSR family fosmidomycin resistance protein-like MFS transporter
MFGNMLPSLLPAIRSEFTLSLSLGGLILAILTLSANGVQMLTGHTRADKTTPLLLHLGLVLSASICLLAVLPKSGAGLLLLIVLAIVSGGGIAIAHPEGLRAVYALTAVPPTISTSVFMTGGFVGYAFGGAISTILVSKFRFNGLYPLLLCPILGILMVIFLKIRMAVEPKTTGANNQNLTDNRLPFSTAVTKGLPFWLVMAMGIPAAISTTILANLIPTHLNELGFELTFGGFSTTVYGIGGAVGTVVWAAVAHRKGELLCSTIALFLVVPFLLPYLLLMDNRIAVWLLFGAGFYSFSAYILTITLARHATGLNLGQRMGFIVGGTWALANIVFMALVPAAERFGTYLILKITPFGYLLSGIFGLLIILKTRSRNPA